MGNDVPSYVGALLSSQGARSESSIRSMNSGQTSGGRKGATGGFQQAEETKAVISLWSEHHLLFMTETFPDLVTQNPSPMSYST